MKVDHRTPSTAAVQVLENEPQAISGRQCPVCASWQTTRHSEFYRVWFTCDRCHAVFS